MIPNPTHRVLFTFSEHGVKSLLIGGQACILYGAVEFSRDTDFIVLCDPFNHNNLKKALRSLKARQIYVPPLELRYLNDGHGCHFRCNLEEIKGFRIDILGKMRGCDDFDQLWERRTTATIDKTLRIEIIGLQDLVASKKTQRDKDWFMLTRLVDNDILLTTKPGQDKIKWWLSECRTVETLEKLCERYEKAAQSVAEKRPVLKYVLSGNKQKTLSCLKKEERIEREADRKYWVPLKKELERLRREKR